MSNLSDFQQTVAGRASLRGIGLHTGEETTVTVGPREPDGGIAFVRKDLPGEPEVKVCAENASIEDSLYLTALGRGEEQILTVEHILAACNGLGIDNLTIELTSKEPPIADGSALPFVRMIRQAGIVTQDRPRRYLEIDQPIWLFENGLELAVIPSPRLEVTYKIDYDHPAVGIRSASFLITDKVFEEKIAPARTFTFLKDIQSLRDEGKIRGGSLDCAIVIGDESFLNNNLRFDDEIVRHKILDVLGDLTLVGRPLKGHVIAVRSGHAFNVRFVRQVLLTINNREEQQRRRMQMPLDINRIREILPHRYPFLLIDRITEIDYGNRRVVGIKNISGNEPFFQGHFPERPIMPGVLIVEAMAQVGGVLLLSLEGNLGKMAYLSAITDAKLRRPVVPGDQLVIETQIVKIKGRTGRVDSRATVDGQRAAEATLLFTMVDKT
jgi:UDP-3-O-[3-hydroxymyristoyl] N-acetylglucosamine deacetylase/3-hydroxyacyl-[acyl-carrier-protein] dehydratase